MNKFPYNKEAIKSNIFEVYECCSFTDIQKGKQWYFTANAISEDIGKRHNKPLITVVGVLAGLSPLSSWDWNILNTDLYFQGVYKHTGNQINKCQLIEKTTDYDSICKILNGRKIVSFFNNILSPYANEYITIDRHSLSVAGFHQNSCTRKQYDFLVDCYKEAANELDIKGHHLQASTWIYFRKNKSKNNGKI